MAYNSTLFEDALPWAVSESDRRFIGIVAISLFVSTLLYVIIQFLPKPVIEQKKLEDVSPRLAKLIIEKKLQPKPTPVPQKKEPEKAKEKPKEPEKTKDKPKQKEKEKVPEPKPQPSPEQRADKAREKAAQSGLMAMQDQLADLRQSFNVASIQNQKPVATAGANKASENTDNTSSLIATKAGQGSGGINTGGLSRSTGGNNLAGRDTTAVKSTINSSGGGKGRSTGGGGSGNSRGDEEIELVFQENKGNIFSIYNRYLRQDPTLKGKLVLQITIAPNGRVTNVRVVSSELKNTELEQKIVSRVKLFQFKPSSVDTVTVTYPIDFLPS